VSYLTPSERLDDRLQTVVCARPGQLGAPPSVFAAVVAVIARKTLPVRERTAQTWRWRRQLGATVTKRRSN
jgi:hypothetical protein